MLTHVLLWFSMIDECLSFLSYSLLPFMYFNLYRNGDTYAGEYFADKMHGFGVYSFANGHHYEGAWHEGRRQGLGMYTFRNGETQSGHWQKGILDIPSTQSTTYPVSPVAVYHSKVLNAVQVLYFQPELCKAPNILAADKAIPCGAFMTWFCKCTLV